MDYSELENNFDCACQDAVNSLSSQYKSDYQPGGPGKLSAFLDLIQRRFDEVELAFIRNNALAEDAEALKRIRAIAKMYAKRCVDDYGRISQS